MITRGGSVAKRFFFVVAEGQEVPEARKQEVADELGVPLAELDFATIPEEQRPSTNAKMIAFLTENNAEGIADLTPPIYADATRQGLFYARRHGVDTLGKVRGLLADIEAPVLRG